MVSDPVFVIVLEVEELELVSEREQAVKRKRINREVTMTFRATILIIMAKREIRQATKFLMMKSDKV